MNLDELLLILALGCIMVLATLAYAMMNTTRNRLSRMENAETDTRRDRGEAQPDLRSGVDRRQFTGPRHFPLIDSDGRLVTHERRMGLERRL